MSLLKLLCRKSVFDVVKFRNFGTRKINDPIVVTDDGSTIVCWHEASEVPYEWTRPIPISVPEAEKVLRAELPTANFKRKSGHVEREELMKMTYTTKHRWFPKNRLRQRKTPKDREYL